MAEKKKVVEKKVVELSEAAQEFKKVIDAYKESNPKKYELKKDALEAKLAALSK